MKFPCWWWCETPKWGIKRVDKSQYTITKRLQSRRFKPQRFLRAYRGMLGGVPTFFHEVFWLSTRGRATHGWLRHSVIYWFRLSCNFDRSAFWYSQKCKYRRFTLVCFIARHFLLHFMAHIGGFHSCHQLPCFSTETKEKICIAQHKLS